MVTEYPVKMIHVSDVGKVKDAGKLCKLFI